MIKAGVNGAVTWVDLSTPDIEGAITFYPELLGWDEIERSETPQGSYHIGNVGDHGVGGMMQQNPALAGTPATWTTYFYVDDIDATVARISELGGNVLTPPFEIPDAQIAIAADPTGGMFGLFAGPEIDGEYYSMAQGAVSWTELLTWHTAKAKPFYSELFGWHGEASDARRTPYTVFKLGDESVAGMLPMPDAVPAGTPSHWSVCFTVTDCAGTEALNKELGGQVLTPTMAIDMGKFAVLADPAGATFDILEYAA